jgi:hypothetical protein
MEDHEYIAGIETWGSGGHMLDVVTLKDGRVLMIGDGPVVLYESRSEFERGDRGTSLARTGEAIAPAREVPAGRPRLRAVSSEPR